MKYDDLYDRLDKGFLQERANHSASYEGGHHDRQDATTASRDFDPAEDDSTTCGQTCN